MLVSKSLVFIHLTKCGGTFVRSALAMVDGPIQHEGRYHGTWSELPTQYQTMPVITAVRNPYDWWVSWYHFMQTRGWFNPIARAAVVAGKSAFPDMLEFIIESHQAGSPAAATVDRMLQDYAKAMGTEQNDFDEKMTGHMRSHQCGILSWRYAFQLEGVSDDQLSVIRQESLLDDLQKVLAKVDCELQPDQRQQLINLPRANTTQRKANYREYYNESSQQSVASLDKMILDKFSYEF